MTQTLTIASLRAELGLTLREFSKVIGFASLGNLSMIERGAPCSPALALAIERLSIKNGEARIDAASLNKTIDAARAVPRTGTADDPDRKSVV